MTDLPLSSILDTASAGLLRSRLLQMIERREAIVLHGGEVGRIGQACLQVLESARVSATAAGLNFSLVQPSEVMTSMLTLTRLDALLEPAA